MAIIEITTPEQLEEVVRRSFASPVLVFKHSIYCGISSNVLSGISDLEADIHMVVVQKHRDLIQTVTELTGHKHESPQAFVLVNGEPVYAAAHYDIERDDIVRILRENSPHGIEKS